MPSAHPDNATLHVLAAFLRNGFLHQAIRERGAVLAAGQVGMAVPHRSASFPTGIHGCRPPWMISDQAIQWLLDKSHPDHQLEEAILSVIATMDKSTSPAGEAKRAFL